jgi:hypothetical protein
VSAKRDPSEQLEVPEALTQKISLLYPAATYNVTGTDSSWQCFRSILRFLPKQCSSANLLDVSGSWITGSGGTVTLSLTDFICLPATFVAPVNLVATAVSAGPLFVTVEHALVNNGNDVAMTFTTWNADGTAAPETTFDWRCRVPYSPVIF